MRTYGKNVILANHKILEAIQLNDMREEIEIRRCSLCKPVDRDEAKYQTDIIATSCTWRESLDVNHSLKESPIAGQTYFVILNQPVKFWLNMDLWLYYDSPLVSINGYETEQQVEQSRFCYGQLLSVISQNEAGVTVQFEVKQTLTLQELLTTRPVKELPAIWTDFYLSFIERDEYSLLQYGKYFQLSVSVQGDIGLSCIVTKTTDQYLICKIDDWSFSEHYTFGGKYLLPDIIREKVF